MFVAKLVWGGVSKCLEKRTPPLHKLIAEYPEMTFEDNIKRENNNINNNNSPKDLLDDDDHAYGGDRGSYDGDQTANHSVISEHERCILFLEMVQQVATTQRAAERDKFHRNALHIAVRILILIRLLY